MFHGAQPDTVELEVHEQNGHADGTFLARFKCRPGVTASLRPFHFCGRFRRDADAAIPTDDQRGNTRHTIELIPGPAFNLLEVNFQTDPQANKIRAGNFILVKK